MKTFIEDNETYNLARNTKKKIIKGKIITQVNTTP